MPMAFRWTLSCAVRRLLGQNSHIIMPKIRKKLTAVEKKAKKAAKIERQKKYLWVFMNGKQVRFKRPLTIDGVS